MTRPGLIDFNVDKGPDGLYHIGKTVHVKRAPGDSNPDIEAHIEYHPTKKEALARAKELARTADADQASVIFDGDEIEFFDNNKLFNGEDKS